MTKSETNNISAKSAASSAPDLAPIKIVMVQDVFQVGDIKCNADKVIDAAIEASKQGADLVVFPELALVGYPPEDLLHRQGFLNQVKAECSRIQQSLKDSIGDTGVIFGLPVEIQKKQQEAQFNDLYNAAVYLLHGEIEKICCKQSLPNYSVFDEVRYFVPGDECAVINVKGHRLGLLICEDVWQQGIVKRSVQDGAQALLVMNASPFHVGKH